MRNARILGIGLTVSCLVVGVAGYSVYKHRYEHSAEVAYRQIASIDLCDYKGQVVETEFLKSSELLIRIGRLDGGSGQSAAVATQVAEKLGKIGAVGHLKRMENSLLGSEAPTAMVEPFARYRVIAEMRRMWPDLVVETEWTGENLESGEFLMAQLAEYLSRFPDQKASLDVLNMSLEAMNDSPQALKLYRDLADRPIPKRYLTIVKGRITTKTRVGSGVDISLTPENGASFHSRSYLGKWVVVAFAQSGRTDDPLHRVLRQLTSHRTDIKVAVSYSDSPTGSASPAPDSWEVIFEGENDLGFDYGIIHRPNVLVIDPQGLLVSSGMSAAGLEQYFVVSERPLEMPRAVESPTYLRR